MTVVNFVVAKMRVTPLQSQTVPRLELQSAILLSTLIVSVVNSLQPVLPEVSVRCYTDSQVALYWIRGIEKKWKPFVKTEFMRFVRMFTPVTGAATLEGSILLICHRDDFHLLMLPLINFGDMDQNDWGKA